MKNSKRILSVLLVLCMVVTLFSSLTIRANAETTRTSGTTGAVTWTLDGTKLTISGSGKMDDYDKDGNMTSWGRTITEVVIKNGVTSIGKYAFYDCASLKSITIPNSVTNIGYGAFWYCFSLKSITIPNSVTSIDSEAFYSCSNLKSIKISNSVTSIGWQVFKNCSSLESITIPKSVRSIGYGAFYNCSSLKSITMPNSVTSIDRYAFYDCTSLKSITVPDSVTYIGYGAFDNTAYCNNTSNWKNGVLYIGKQLIKADSKNIPNSYSIKNGTLTIADGAFKNCTSLKSITIPASVTSISGDAFYDCTSLKSITIPKSVTSIDQYAFKNCTSLKSITIPDSVRSIGYGAFENCTSLKSITVPDSVTSIGGDAFYNTAYYNNASNWENGVLYIGKQLIELYSESNLNSCSIKKGTLTIADQAFWGCSSLESIKIPVGVINIGDDVFENCSSLKSIKIPVSVTNIGDIAFWGCSSLKKITIPVSVTSIGEDAFHNCSNELVICGKSGSYAEKYAKANKIIFTACRHTDTYITGAKAATCTKTGYTGDTKCNACGVVKAKSKTINNVKSIELAAVKYVYNGKTKTPNVVVKDSKGKALKKGTDYTVTYASGRKNVGKYTVKVTLKGNYSGSKTLSFKINPAATTLTSLSAGKKQFTVKWKKQSTQTTGYEIQYSTSKNMKSAKTATISNAKTTSTTVKSLNASKTYYVRIRTYKTVKGTKIYSAWSAIKNVEVKK